MGGHKFKYISLYLFRVKSERNVPHLNCRHRVARQQVRQPHHGRRSAADFAPQRLQDRKSDALFPHQPRGARDVLPRLRVGAALRGGRRPRRDARQNGRDDGLGHRGDPRHPAARTHRKRHRASLLADDRVPRAEGLDRPEGSGRQAGGRVIPRAPGADQHGKGRTSGTAGGVAAELPAGGTVR